MLQVLKELYKEGSSGKGTRHRENGVWGSEVWESMRASVWLKLKKVCTR